MAAQRHVDEADAVLSSKVWDKEKWIRTCKKGWNPDWSQKHIQGLLDYQVNVVYEEIDKNDAVRRNALD